MQNANAWQSYRQVATLTATPGQLVLMLYDGAIRFLEQARAGFAHDDPLEFNQTINNQVIKAQAIINELNLYLDMKNGGDCASNFRRLYDYLDRRLQESNQRKEEKGIQEVISRLTVLRNAWAEMLKQGTTAEPGAIHPSLCAIG
ncbi:MAG: flagellar secretion chaperone FliS [Verrucomicrobiota bacterium]|jgi:flagellar protein FliS